MASLTGLALEILQGKAIRALRHGSPLPGIPRFGWPFIGFLPHLRYSTAGFHDVLARMVALGGEDGMAYSWVGPSLMVTIYDPRMVHQFFKHSTSVSRDYPTLSLFSPAGSLKRMLGTSLFFHADDQAKPINGVLRRHVGKGGRVESYYGLAKRIATRHVERFDAKGGGPGTALDLVSWSDDFADDLWHSAFFGEQEVYARDPEVSTLVFKLTSASTSFRYLFTHLLWSVFNLRWPNLPSAKEKSVRHSFDGLVYKRLDAYLEGAEAAGGDVRDDKPSPLLGSLLKMLPSRESALISGEMREPSKVAVFSGAQSAKHYITWVTYELNRKPEMLERVREELATLMPEGVTLDDLPYAEFAKGTPLLNAILDETSRLYAPSFALVRAVIRDIPLETPTGKPVTLSPGTIVMTTTQQMHTSPTIWGPSATEWRPDRFLRELSPEQRLAYMPTGCGIRSCPGSELSMMGIKASLMLMLQGYDVRIEGEEVVPGFVAAKMMSKAPCTVERR